MDIILGFALLSNGINLIIMFTSEDPDQKTVPIITGTSTQSIVDPIPQALVLTAIVIGFSLIVFLTVLAFRLHISNEDSGIRRVEGEPDR
jgi:multisubunit Na+/H+ antiporter MnhC subunit